MTRRRRTLVARAVTGIVALAITLLGSRADSFPQQSARPEPRLGVATFTERSSWSRESELQMRLRWPSFPEEARYRLADESFATFVPEAYDPGTPHGLLVWVSPVSVGGPLPDYLPVLEQERLIWIGARNAGNQRHVGVRIGLALDAVHNAAAQYTLDSRRIYVGGMSGGGRTASMLTLLFPELFDGGLYVVGANFFEDVPLSDGVLRRNFLPPPPDLLAHAMANNRYVFVTGEADYNREQMELVAARYRSTGFRSVEYLEVPAMGHAYPDATWFARAVDALDGDAG